MTFIRVAGSSGRRRRITLAGLRRNAWAGVLACLVAAGVAETSRAGVVITPQESQDGWLQFTWTGSLNTTGGTIESTVGGGLVLYGPQDGGVPGFLQLYFTPASNNDLWSATGPTTRFGTGTSAFTFSGAAGTSTLAMQGNRVMLNVSYVSGSPLTGTTTFENYPYASAGLVPGNYTWTLAGSGDTVVMQVAAVPEPSTCAMLLAG